MRCRHSLFVLALLASGCSAASKSSPAAQPTSAGQSDAEPASEAPASQPEHVCPCALEANTVSACPNWQGRPAGCLLFQTPANAISHVINSEPTRGVPQILALGETHALAGNTGLKSTTARFTSDLLPRLAAYRAIVVEALIPASGCKAMEQKAREQTKAVTEQQAQGNQNEFLQLAERAKAQNVVPYPLRLSCDDMQAIASAPEGPIETSMRLIASKTQERAQALLKEGRAPLLLYGGALHNDVQPLPGREPWSYGPVLAKLPEARYVELDLITREFVQARPPWTDLPWFEAYKQNCASNGTLLIRQGERSYVLVLPWQTEHHICP